MDVQQLRDDIMSIWTKISEGYSSTLFEDLKQAKGAQAGTNSEV